MPIRLHQYALLLFLAPAAGMCSAASDPLNYAEQTFIAGETRATVRLPQGAQLQLLTDKLDNPRLLSFASNGDLFIGSHSGKIYRLPPPYVTPEVLLSLDGYPHSIALRKNEILIARTDGLYRTPYQLGQKRIDAKSVSLLARLPSGGGHSSRTVSVGPDGRVYVSLGIQSNCSDQYLSDNYSFDDRRGGILVLREDNGQARWETYGSGLRNPVGFAWQPHSGEMYASNNGPDHWGFLMPPEYFSRITPGSFHGMPWFQFDGKKLQRDDCVSSHPPRPLTEVTPPVATFPARNAPMGVSFVPKGALNPLLEFDAIVALHGSWATLPNGGSSGDPASRRPPKLVAVRFKNGTAVRVDDLVTGFQRANGVRWARPVGVAVGPDGALYFTSDDGINGLFRLQWK